MARGVRRAQVDVVEDRDVKLPRNSSEMVPALRERLVGLDKDRLVDLVVERVEGDYEAMQRLLLALSIRPEATGDGLIDGLIDGRLVAQRVRNILDACPTGQDEWDGEQDMDDDGAMELGEIVAGAVERGEGGDVRNAMAILRIVLATAADVAAESPEDYEGALRHVIDDAAKAAIGVALSPDLPANEREAHAARLAEAGARMHPGKEKVAVGSVRRALESGWDTPWIVGILDGSAKKLPAWTSERLAEEATLLPNRYEALRRSADAMGRARLASAFGDAPEAACALVEAERADDAVAYARASLREPAGVLRLAETLWKVGQTEKAVEFGARGLSLPGSGTPADGYRTPVVSLAHWVREAAYRAGDAALAVKAAFNAFEGTQSLADLQRAKALSGDRWGELRGDYLALIDGWGKRIDKLPLLMEEKEYDRAIAHVEDARAWDYRNPEPVFALMGKVARTHPDWVIRTAHKCANAVLEQGNANTYRLGVKWLERSAVAHRAAGRQGEWTMQIDILLNRYGRKRNLKPLLLALRARTVPDDATDEPGIGASGLGR